MWLCLIAEHLSVRLIIVQVLWVLVGPKSEVVLVCLYVCNGFTIEIYGFMHCLRTFWHVPLRMPYRTMAHGMEIEVEDLEDRRRHQNESRCMEDG